MVEWIPTSENESDIKTKNAGSKTYNKHVECFVSRDEYILEATEANGTSGLIPPGIDQNV